MRLGLARYQVQFDKHRFENIIFEHQQDTPDPHTTHVEWIFYLNDRTVLYSSSGRGGFFSGHGLWPGVGTRFINLSDIEPRKWKIDECQATDDQIQTLYDICLARIGKPYDWLGVIGKALPFNIQLDQAVYCNEEILITGAMIFEKLREYLKSIGQNPIRPKTLPGETLHILKNSAIMSNPP